MSSPDTTSPELPLPPLEMRQLVGPTEPEFFDNPSGQPVLPGVDPSAYESVLDFGCGCGRLARQMIQADDPPRRYLGVDLHPDMIRWAAENLSPHAAQFEFRHHDVAHPVRNPGPDKAPVAPLPGDDGEFSLVIAYSVFTHLVQNHAEHYLSEVARVLAPTGTFFATWFLFDKRLFPMMQDFQDALYINNRDPSNAVIFDGHWLRDAAARNGLVINWVRPPNVRGFHWTIQMTPRREGVVEVELPVDDAPISQDNLAASPFEPTALPSG